MTSTRLLRPAPARHPIASGPTRRSAPASLVTPWPGRAGTAWHRPFLLGLQRSIGNAATSLLLQRAGGWPGAATAGPAWNDARAKQVAKVWRVAIAGLAGGATDAFRGGDSEHTSEAADHRAIVLLPTGFDVAEPMQVLLYFHGHTETWRDEYAGFRQRSFKATKETKKAGLTSDNQVRDVALDQMEDQISAAGKSQMIGILAQGGPQHQFGDIKVDDYIRDVLTRVATEYPNVLPRAPSSWSVILSGHSGGGTAVANALAEGAAPAQLAGIVLFDAESMAGEITRRVEADLAFLVDASHTDPDRRAYLAGRPPVRVVARDRARYGKMYGTLVPTVVDAFAARLIDRRGRGRLASLRVGQAAFSAQDQRRMDELTARKDRSADDAAELRRLRALRPLTPGQVRELTGLAARSDQADVVDRFRPDLLALYHTTLLDPATVEHEEIVRGSHADSGAYQAGTGNLEQALRSL